MTKAQHRGGHRRDPAAEHAAHHHRQQIQQRHVLQRQQRRDRPADQRRGGHAGDQQPQRRRASAAADQRTGARPGAGATSSSSPETMCTLISPARRSGFRRQASSAAGERHEATARPADDDLGDVLAPRDRQDLGDVVACGNPRGGRAQPLGEPHVVVEPLRRGRGSRCCRAVRSDSAVHGALRPEASRLAVRTTRSDRVSSPTSTSSRSAVAHGPSMAPWRSRSTIWSSTRSAVRRSASSRRAVRLAGRKKPSMARWALSGR